MTDKSCSIYISFKLSLESTDKLHNAVSVTSSFWIIITTRGKFLAICPKQFFELYWVYRKSHYALTLQYTYTYCLTPAVCKARDVMCDNYDKGGP